VGSVGKGFLATLIALLVAISLALQLTLQASSEATGVFIKAFSSNWVNMSIVANGIHLGELRVVVVESTDLPYTAILSYTLYPESFEVIAGFRPQRALVLVERSIVGARLWEYYELRDEIVGFSGSIDLMSGARLDPRVAYRIVSLSVRITVEDGYRVYGYRFDLTPIIQSVRLTETPIVPGLREYIVDFTLVNVTESFAIYRIARGPIALGTLIVSAYPSFSNASNLLVEYRVPYYIRGCPDVMISVEIESSGETLKWNYTLKPGEMTGIPAQAPIKLAGLAQVKRLELIATWMNFKIKVLNVTRDVGLINLRPVQIQLLEYPLKVVKIEPLGNGWVAVYAGVNLSPSISSKASFIPDPGSISPILVRVIELRGMYNHTLTYKVLMAFVERGLAKGTLVVERVELGRPSVVLKAPLEFIVDDVSLAQITPLNLTPLVTSLKEFKEIELTNLKIRLAKGYYEEWEKPVIESLIARLEDEIKTIDPRTVAIVFEVGKPLGYSSFLALHLTLNVTLYDTRKPLTIRVEPVFNVRGPTPLSDRYVYWVNCSTTGLSYTPSFTGWKVLNLTILVGYTLEEYVSGALSQENTLSRILVVLDNIGSLSLARGYYYILNLSSPRLEARALVSDFKLDSEVITPRVPLTVLLVAVILVLLLATLLVAFRRVKWLD